MVCLLFCSISASAEMYKVTAKTSVNVRNAATTKSKIVGKLRAGTQVEVFYFQGNWARINYNNRTAFVSAQFLEKVPEVHNPEVNTEPAGQENEILTTPTQESYALENDSDNSTGSKYLFSGNALNSSDISLFLAIQAGCGWSNFLWDQGDANGDISYGAAIALELNFNNRVAFIPRNWYSELSLGYKKLGAAQMGINYIGLNIIPLGYRFPISKFSLVAKAGVSLSMPLNSIETDYNTFDANFQASVIGGLQLEYKHFGIGVSAEYGFMNALDLEYNTLNNIAVMGSLIYKFGKL